MKERHVEPPNSMQLSEMAVYTNRSCTEGIVHRLNGGDDVSWGMVPATTGTSVPVTSESWPR